MNGVEEREWVLGWWVLERYYKQKGFKMNGDRRKGMGVGMACSGATPWWKEFIN
jgi:hypothetical protein